MVNFVAIIFSKYVNLMCHNNVSGEPNNKIFYKIMIGTSYQDTLSIFGQIYKYGMILWDEKQVIMYQNHEILLKIVFSTSGHFHSTSLD